MKIAEINRRIFLPALSTIKVANRVAKACIVPKIIDEMLEES
jgi:hypothetical protein